jgi:hypothetical protein
MKTFIEIWPYIQPFYWLLVACVWLKIWWGFNRNRVHHRFWELDTALTEKWWGKNHYLCFTRSSEGVGYSLTVKTRYTPGEFRKAVLYACFLMNPMRAKPVLRFMEMMDKKWDAREQWPGQERMAERIRYWHHFKPHRLFYVHPGVVNYDPNIPR